MKRIQTTSKLPAILLGLSLSLLVGCSLDADPSQPSAPGDTTPTGTFAVALSVEAGVEPDVLKSTTSSLASYDELVLVLRGISAHRAAGDTLDGWYGREFEPIETSLQDLTTELGELIAEAELPVGPYNQVRLLLGEGSYVIVGDEDFPLTVPSGLSNGIGLQHHFEIVAGRTYSTTLVFDTTRSVRLTRSGEYVLKPRIRITESFVADREVGTIVGIVTPSDAEATISLFADGRMLTALADPVTGEFELPGVVIGVYTVEVTPAAGTWYPTIALTGIPVRANEITDLGTIRLMMPVK